MTPHPRVGNDLLEQTVAYSLDEADLLEAVTTPDPCQEYVDREHLRDCRREAVRRILSAMHYQTRPGVHTMGYCSKGCGRSAHGAGVCKECLREELANEVGRNFADAFTTAYFEARRVESEIWEEVER